MRRNTNNHEDAIIGAMFLGVPVFDLAPAQFAPRFFSDPVLRAAFQHGEGMADDVNRWRLSERVAGQVGQEPDEVLARFDRVAVAAQGANDEETRQHFQQVSAEYAIEENARVERTKAKLIKEGKIVEAMRLGAERAEYLEGLLGEDDGDTSLEDQIEEFENPIRDPVTIETGIHFIDTTFGPFEEGQLVLIPGRPSQGKSSFAVHLADTFNARGGHVGFISMEESEGKLAAAVLAHRLNRSRSEFKGISKQKKLSPATLAALRSSRIEGAGNFRMKTIYGGNIRQIQMTASRMAKEHGAKIIIVDHVNLIDVPGISPGDEYARVSYASAALKRMAGRLGVVVIAPTQLNRSAVDSRSNRQEGLSLGQLRGSGSLEQDADIICGLELHRLKGVAVDDAKEGPNVQKAFDARACVVDFRFLKSRDGKVGVYTLWWEKETGRFSAHRWQTGSSDQPEPQAQAEEGSIFS